MRTAIIEGDTSPSLRIESPIRKPGVSPLMRAADFYLSLWREAQNNELSAKKRQAAQSTLRKYSSKLGLVLARIEVEAPELSDQAQLLRQAYAYATKLNRQVAIAKASQATEPNIHTSQVYGHNIANR